jgi:hypothetical protein
MKSLREIFRPQIIDETPEAIISSEENIGRKKSLNVI